MKGFLTRLSSDTDWKKRWLEKWIRFSADFDHSLNGYRFNAALSLGLILLWLLITTAIVNLHANPFFSAIQMYQQHLPRFVVACLFYLIGWYILAKQKGRRVKKFLFLPLPPRNALLWGVVLLCTWLTLFPDPLGVDPVKIHGNLDQWGNVAQQDPGNPQLWEQLWIRFVVYTSVLYTWHLPLCALWYAMCSLHTLVFIMRNKRAKLRVWWGLQLAGFTILPILYAISPILGSFCTVTIPHEVLDRWLKAGTENDLTLRGSELTTSKKARYNYRKALDAESRLNRSTFPFGRVDVPISQLVTHAMVVGSSGSGKTLTLHQMAQAALPLIIPAGIAPCRGVLYDPKRNALATLTSIENLSADIKILNPFDRRACRYDLAADFTTMTGAQSLGQMLIPPPKANEHGDPFFHAAATGMVTAVTMAFINNAPGNWRLADIVRAFANQQTLIAVLQSDEQAQMYAAALGSERTSANILSSVCVELLKFAPLAALWQHTTETVSVRDWMNGGQLWVLGQNQDSPVTMSALNRVILGRMSQCLLTEGDTENRQPRTFLFLDELQSLHLDHLESLVEQGRSKSICVIGAFQSIQAMYKQYGKETTDAMLGQIRHKAFLKLSDSVTAEWASQQFGDVELKRTQGTTKFNTGAAGLIVYSDRTGGSQIIQQTRLVLASEIMHVPAINDATGQGMTGYYMANTELYKDYTPWNTLEQLITPPNPLMDNFQEAPASWQKLVPWTADDWERLGIADAMHRLTTAPLNPTVFFDGGRHHV
jgi:type IV secretory pathway TraG/TraD family ATPase VirD4